MNSSTAEDPFQDPLIGHVTPQPAQPSPRQTQPAQPNLDVPATLTVGRNASLTLGTDALIVQDADLKASKGASLCGISLPGKNKSTRSIPFYNILWAEHSTDGHVVIHYAHAATKTAVRPAIIDYDVDKPESTLVEAWIAALLDRAYGLAQRRKRIKVLVNPFGGQGKALKTYDNLIAPILAAARCELDVQKTERQGHGIDIAQNMDIDAFDAVACCSGDGIPHEVWNGLGKRTDAARALNKVAVVQMPCGSGNAASWNFNGTSSPSLAALAVVKGLRTPLDLSSVTQGDTRILSFCSQSVGIVAEVDLATENLRWMGDTRFTVGFLQRVLKKTVYPADIAVKVEYDNKEAVRKAYRAEASKKPGNNDPRDLPHANTSLPPLKYGTINDPLPAGWELIPHDHLGNFYAGNIAYMSADANFFPASLPADGCLDLIRIRGDLPRLKAIKTLLSIESHTFFDLPHVDYKKISAYRIIPRDQKDGYISIDGERVKFEGFQVEVHKALGTTLSKSGHLCEAKGV
ncbi:sphingoid long chain base kinase-like protein [Phaeosphaeria sp. MPI-PUGE-AT-0046c]|nr:sphingoid long chain base kinase-like protein [Phaeosphaeria sp. MPI-PUGE-AT-0046c]